MGPTLDRGSATETYVRISALFIRRPALWLIALVGFGAGALFFGKLLCVDVVQPPSGSYDDTGSNGPTDADAKE